MTQNYNIISCDGGGIRGLITTLLLDDLVTNPPHLNPTNKPLSNVSLFAGTSTGAIIAVGLASGLAPSTLKGIYESACGTIFTKYKDEGLGLWVEYTDNGLYNTLRANLPNYNSPLSSLSPDVVLATFRMSNETNDSWAPLALSSFAGSPYADMSIIDAIMCSAAAPIYFPPHMVQLSSEKMWCADGGLFANNPSSFALANVLQSEILLEQNMRLANVRLLSLGTGATTDYVVAAHLADRYRWGVDSWLNPDAHPPEPDYPLLNSMFDAQSQLVDFEMRALLQGQYMRANPTLTKTIPLDSCADAVPNGTLENIAQEYIKTDVWQNIKSWVYFEFI